ncbi:MAG: hypothetical protein RDU14_07745, partial [Melioribacteraceae bacterium]|nr:hypothetical protein [Melioribacteraceae bacterium]
MKKVMLLFSIFLLSFNATSYATTYYSTYGQSRTWNITVIPGTHKFEVDKIASNMNTEWYVNKSYQKTQNSGLLAYDPDFSYNFSSGTTEIKAIVYTSSWAIKETHVWNVSIQSYTISLSSSPSNAGSTSGAGTFTAGTSRTVSASANSGYTFSKWTESGSQVSTSSSYTFALNSNRTLVANFTANTYTISTSSNPSSGGTTSGGGTKTHGSSVTVTASANTGYNFVNWTEGGNQVSTSTSYSFTATSNRTLVANFAAKTYTISTSSSPSAGGTTSGGGSKTHGSSVTLTATANTGYNFVNWTESGN